MSFDFCRFTGDGYNTEKKLPIRWLSFLTTFWASKRKNLIKNLAEERKPDSSQILSAVRLGRLTTRFLIEEVENCLFFTDDLCKSYINQAKVSVFSSLIYLLYGLKVLGWENSGVR